MDALTNVVAVLIFVLLLVNCEVAQTVVKIMEDVVPVSDEEMRLAQEMLKQIDLDAKRLEELRKQPQPSVLEFEQLQKAMEALKKLKDEKLKKIQAQAASVSELQKRHAQALAARDEEQQENVTMQEEIRRLEILLDTTPEEEEDIKPTEITIPATRPIPPGAKMHYAYIINDKIHVCDPTSVLEAMKKKADSLKNDESFLAGPGVFDRNKLFPALQGLDFKLPEGQSVNLTGAPWANSFDLRINFSPDAGGVKQEDLKQPSNGFTSALSKIRNNEVLMFRVSPESMYTYALAREIVDKKNLPCGWQIIGPELNLPDMNLFYFNKVDGIAIKATEARPERDPNRPKKEKGPKQGAKLD
jgi:hypothetical protein